MLDPVQDATETPVIPGAAALGESIDTDQVTEMTQDVRFAVSMAGGVSLAVWMGGVSREVNLLQQASDSRPGNGRTTPWAGPDPIETAQDAVVRNLYRNLLELLDMTVAVDVLSGTSAGGINAALLGMSSAGGVDLVELRDLWLSTGSMDILLRDPSEKNPPSLMQGDKVLYARLADGIRGFHDARRRRGEPTPRETTVYITTTMMSGETSRFTDSYGTLVPDVDHHGLFTFDRDALAPRGPGRDAESLTALALAARSSASFPGAFEPSFIPIGDPPKREPGGLARPDMRSYANMTRSHWVADGGLLANRPLSPLLSTVFARPADREVRRILAFVVPDGGGTADPADTPNDQWGKPFTLATALRNDLNAQFSQSIASDLLAIRQHNERLDADHDLRRTLAEIGAMLAPKQRLVTPRMLHDYAVEQGAALARPLLDELMRQMSTMKIPDSWNAELSPDQEAGRAPIGQRLVEIMADECTGKWSYPPTGADQDASGTGQAPGPDAVTSSAPDPFAQMAKFGRPALHAAQAIAIHLVRLGYRCATEADQRSHLAAHRKAISKTVAGLSPFDDRKVVDEQVKTEVEKAPILPLEEIAKRLASTKWAELTRDGANPAGGGESLVQRWQGLENEVGRLLATLREIVDHRPSKRPQRKDAAGAIATYCGYLGVSDDSPAGSVASRLLDLVIAHRALRPVEAEVDQPVELIQVSANTRTLLSDQKTVRKLRGVELHHFAAFYKSSWRAFDWTWGRLDGCGWLVHILLDPRRILAICEDHPKTYGEPGERSERFLAALLAAADMKNVDDATRKDLLTNLEFLKSAGEKIPVSLPKLALFIARAWQEVICANELPVVASQMLADDGHGSRRPAPPDTWATKVREMQHFGASAQRIAGMLPTCPVQNETLGGQLRTPAFVRTASKAAAVATAALATAPEAPPSIRPVLTSARTVTNTGYRATQVTGGSARTMLAIGIVLAIVGGALATQGVMIVGVTGAIIALAGLYLIALAAWGLQRGLLWAIAGITALALIASLTLAWVRKVLWGDGGKTLGWIPGHILPWLRSTWWGGLTLLGGILALAAIMGWFFHRRRHPRNIGQITQARPSRTTRITQLMTRIGQRMTQTAKALTSSPPQKNVPTGRSGSS